MHSWKIKWADDATEQLADSWLRSADRARISVAADHIDHILEQDPRSPGKEASEGLWRLTVAPRHALYEIDDDKHEAVVTAIGLVNDKI